MSFLTSAATIVGMTTAVIAVLEYTGRGEAERAAASLSLVESWEDDGYRADFAAISNDLGRAISTMSAEETLAIDQSTEEDKALATMSLGDAYLARNGVERVDNLFYFFTKLSVCVRANLCSRHAIDAFFGEPISTFWSYFSSYVTRQRELIPKFADDVETYVATSDDKG